MNPHEHVTLGVLAEDGEPASLEAHHGFRLRTRRHPHPFFTVGRWDRDFDTERRLRERERKIVNQIVTLALETLDIRDDERFDTVGVDGVIAVALMRAAVEGIDVFAAELLHHRLDDAAAET